MGARRFTISTGLALAAAFVSSASPARAADPALIAAAMQEKQLTWYSVQVLDQLPRPLAEAFEKKYPGIKVTFTQNALTDLVTRVTNEGKAGRQTGDVVDGSTVVGYLKKAGALEKYVPDTGKNYPAGLIDPEGYWVATNVTIVAPAYNTKLVPPGTQPKTLQDLLDPKWKDQMAWSSQPVATAGAGFIGVVLSEMGEQKGMAYLQALQKQNINNMQVVARQVLDQVIAGEYKIGLSIYTQNAQFSASQGAPVAWLPIEPTLSQPAAMAIVNGAPHPNAAKLFEDFALSDEGQAVFQKAGYIPASSNVPSLVPNMKPDTGHFRSITISPEQGLTELPQWVKIFKDMFQ